MLRESDNTRDWKMAQQVAALCVQAHGPECEPLAPTLETGDVHTSLNSTSRWKVETKSLGLAGHLPRYPCLQEEGREQKKRLLDVLF